MSTQLSPISQQRDGETPDPIVFSTRYARFAKFHVDLERQELFLEGQRVKMQAKVYQALALLLSQAGEIVTREEVRKHLWPDTFLANLDANVNTTMNKLRQVLGDAPENPQYIETIPRRGYSFIAQLQFSDALAPVGSTPNRGVPDSAPRPNLETAPSFAFPTVRWPMFLRISGVLVAGMLLGALLTFVWFIAQEKNHRGLEPAKASPAAAVSSSHSPNL